MMVFMLSELDRAKVMAYAVSRHLGDSAEKAWEAFHATQVPEEGLVTAWDDYQDPNIAIEAIEAEVKASPIYNPDTDLIDPYQETRQYD